ncbi:MAG: hypothetical protein IAF38_03190, partial [Bacteroidia bacterium]|nr:hypothetical protein [Bacteroidia bacterium]
MKNKIFLAAAFLFSFLSVYCFSADPLAGKYLYKYEPLKTGHHKKGKHYPVVGWDYNDEDRTELLTLNPDGTFILEWLAPLGGPEFLPPKGKWKTTAEGVLVLWGDQYYENEYLYYFEKTFSIFKGNLIERDLTEEKNKSKK